MKAFLTALFYCITFYLSAQTVKGRVIDAATKAPVPFAHVFIQNANTGVSADLDGQFAIICQLPAMATISCIGYKTLQLEVKQTNVVVEISESLTELREIIVDAAASPAHEILKKVYANIEENDPHRLDSYCFNSYNKLFINFSPVATVYNASKSLQARVDSSELFISESVVNHKFRRPGNFHETILAQKTSGTKNPVFASLLTEFQPISFYDEFFYMPVTGKNYYNPIHDQRFTKYEFDVLDTLYSNADSTFVISFNPQDGRNIESMSGLLYVNSQGYAIEHVIANSTNSLDGFAFNIKQQYKKIEGKWFPFQLNTDVHVQDKKNDLYGAHYVHRSNFSEFVFDAPMSGGQFSSPTREVSSNASSMPNEFWQQYRGDGLSKKEMNTYSYFDNHPQRQLDFGFGLIESLSSGYLPYRHFRIPINRLLAFNQYEKARVGFGIESDDHLSKNLSFGLFGGYGIGDKSLKYGGHVFANIRKSSGSFVKIFYNRDLAEPASTGALTKEDQALLADGYRGILASRMDSTQRYGAMFSSSLGPRFSFQFSASHEFRKPTYQYNFIDQDVTLNKFEAEIFSVHIKYAVGERRMNLGRGVFTVTRPVTLIELQASNAIPLSTGSLKFFRVQSTLTKSFLSRTLGKTIIHARTGFTKGQIPYSYLFNGQGTSPSFTFLFIENTFQTMRIYEFLADRYASLFVTQNFGNLLWRTTTPYCAPEIKVTNGIYWGHLSDAARHEGISYRVADHGFMEGGLLVNKLLRVRYFKLLFLDFGIGAFYRYGSCASPKQTDNMSFKLMAGASL